jgi:hypothetical protein
VNKEGKNMRMRNITFVIMLGAIICSSCGTKPVNNKEALALKTEKELLKQAQEEEFTE